MNWFFNNIFWIGLVVSCVQAIFAVCAGCVNTDQHENLEVSLRAVQLLLYFAVIYLMILILGHLLLISLPVYIQFSHLPATVQGVLTNMTGKAHLTTMHNIMMQVNTLALLTVITIINKIDLKLRIKETN